MFDWQDESDRKFPTHEYLNDNALPVIELIKCLRSWAVAAAYTSTGVDRNTSRI